MPSKSLLAVVGAALLYSSAAWSATIAGATGGTNNPAIFDPYIVSLDPVPVWHLNGISANALALLRGAYGGTWTFNTPGTQSPGTLNVLEYQAFALPKYGGAEFSVLYSDGKGDKPTNLDWIQIYYAHNWANRFPNGSRIDSEPGSPFYDDPVDLSDLAIGGNADDGRFVGPSIWKDKVNYPQQDIQNPAGGGSVPQGGNLIFNDEPWCVYTCVPKNDFSSFYLETFLVDFTLKDKNNLQAGGTVNIYDGVGWGVEIACRQAGTCPDPTPEPSTWLSLAAGVMLICLGRVRFHSSRDQATGAGKIE